jgi:dihydrofolate synthase/folylpolyglutamate synthase
MNKILSLLGDPHKNIRFIHVAGTNGKGSTSSYIHNILMAAGYKVGLYTSPHLHCYTDRIRINGVNIEKEDFVNITAYLKNIITSLSPHEMPFPAMFDIMTLMAFVYYQYNNLDCVVLEVGLGGLLDATNIIEKSLASVITPIDIDILGDDQKAIARHKAGIIKRNGLVVSHWQDSSVADVIKQASTDNGAQLYFLNKEDVSINEEGYKGQTFDFCSHGFELPSLTLQMIGRHQANNAALAILTLLILHEQKLIYIPSEAIYRGVYSNIWAGRLELIREHPLLFIDGAHNLQGAVVLAAAIERYFYGRKIKLVIGMLSNKDAAGFLNTLIPVCHQVIFTSPNNPKALEPAKLANQVAFLGKEVHVVERIDEAVMLALETTASNEVTIFTGSLYLIGDVRKIILNHVNSSIIAS